MKESQKFGKDELFTLLITQLSSGAWIQLGKIPDPVTGKTERHLDAASMTIDILDALLSKTAGNLSDDEHQFLFGTINQLKMNYLDELKKPDSEEEKQESDKKEPDKDEPQKKAEKKPKKGKQE